MGFADEQLDGLRSILSQLLSLDLWPPWDAAQTIVDLVAQASAVATQPPEPDPVHLRDASEEWRLVATTVGRAHDDLAAARAATTPDIWEGQAGAGFRGSVEVFETRIETVPVAADAVASALEAMATRMEAARSRHADAWSGLRDHLSLSWSDALPWELADKVAGFVGEVVEAVRDLIGAYEDAAAAAEETRSAVVAAMDGIELPDHLPSAVPSVIDVVNQWDDDGGALDGSVLSRYDDAVDDMTAAEREELRRLLAGTTDPAARAWIIAGVASGLSGEALRRYVERLRQMSPGELRDLDPTQHRGDSVTQPDTTTCGSSALVMSRMENDPAFAMWILTGYDPVTGVTDPPADPPDPSDPDGVKGRFDDAALQMHHTTNAVHDRDGDLQFPWPEAAGTQPWALAGEMSAQGGSGVPGSTYDVETVDPAHAGCSFDAIVRASEEGHTVPFYVGDHTHPGHVALVTGASGDTLTVYEPAHGETITVSRDDWVHGTLDVAGWSQPWFAVVPHP